MDTVRLARAKLIVFALAIFMVAPSSVKISSLVEETYSQSKVYETIDSESKIIDKEVNSEDEDGRSLLDKIKDTVIKTRSAITNSV